MAKSKLASRDNFKPAQVKQTKRPDALPKTFGDAFSQARAAQGDGGTFEWRGKSYSTNVASPASKKANKPTGNTAYKPKKDLGEVTVSANRENGANMNSVMKQQKMNLNAETKKLTKTSSSAPSKKSGMVKMLEKRNDFENAVGLGMAVVAGAATVASMVFGARSNPSKVVGAAGKAGKLGAVGKAITKNTGTMNAVEKNMKLAEAARKGGERVTGSSSSMSGIAKAKKLPDTAKSYQRRGSVVGKGGKIVKTPNTVFGTKKTNTPGNGATIASKAKTAHNAITGKTAKTPASSSVHNPGKHVVEILGKPRKPTTAKKTSTKKK